METYKIVVLGSGTRRCSPLSPRRQDFAHRTLRQRRLLQPPKIDRRRGIPLEEHKAERPLHHHAEHMGTFYPHEFVGHSWTGDLPLTELHVLPRRRRYLPRLTFAAGAVIVYDLGDKETFTTAQKWVLELKRFVNEDVPVVIAGNKADLPERVVDEKDAVTYVILKMTRSEVDSQQSWTPNSSIRARRRARGLRTCSSGWRKVR